MKNLYILFLFVSCHAFSQMALSLRSGICISELSGNYTSNKDFDFGATYGFYTGLSLKYSISKHISIQPELNYTPLGGRSFGVNKVSENDYNSGSPELYSSSWKTVKLNYIEIPLLFRMDFGENLEFSTGIGPFIGVLSDAALIVENTGILYKDPLVSIPWVNEGATVTASVYDHILNFRENVNEFNFGFQWMFSMQYPVGPGMLFFENRFIAGITDVLKNSGKNTNRTSAFSSTLGYSISIITK